MLLWQQKVVPKPNNEENTLSEENALSFVPVEKEPHQSCIPYLSLKGV
jgi:hypothetical protein